MKQQKVTIAKYISILYRNSRRYFDMAMEEDLVGSGQHFFLLRIYENQGITMYDLARLGNFDKGTVTKAVQKLLDMGCIRIETDSRDRRIRHLFVEDGAMKYIQEIYKIREHWQELLFDGFSKEEESMVYEALKGMAERSCMALDNLTGKEQNEKYDTCKTDTGKQ
ncbi:MarR family transcriptional regulator [Ruminococcus sp. OA3]|uniref:MarR family winged helix-turn-helix transcriptional regulator n=1 Tax=Ruminococcus sp. OA3 TaxID=2914164 RepID=UPI001F06024F|nr:MarR family transcriptional regulator [Ruminococcus sp. OA3]MCH1981659.1 MarR family transcriptional regulator [Ruminococcus sp. OA3]